MATGRRFFDSNSKIGRQIAAASSPTVAATLEGLTNDALNKKLRDQRANQAAWNAFLEQKKAQKVETKAALIKLAGANDE